jgi:hypothetical protein
MPIVEKQERRTCEGCGYERMVKVVYMGHPEPNHPSWDRYCKVCVLRARAKSQRTQASKNEAKANELLALRRIGSETE